MECAVGARGKVAKRISDGQRDGHDGGGKRMAQEENEWGAERCHTWCFMTVVI